jgi:hypothetical protein
VRVAIIAEDVGAPMVARLRAELSGVGVVPAVIERVPPADLSSLIAEVGGVGVFAFIDDRLEVVVADALGHTSRQEMTLPLGDPLEESRAGVRAIEMLRAGLLEVHEAELGPRVDAGSLTVLELAGLGSVSSSGNDQLTTLSVGTELASGHMKALPTLNVVLGLAHGVGPRTDIVFGGGLPVLRTRFIDDAGEAVFGISVVRLGVAHHLSDSDQAWVPTLGAGLGVRFLRISGEADVPYSDETIVSAGLAPFGYWGMSYWPGGPLRLRGDLHMSVARRAAVFFVNREVGAWGPVQMGFVFGVEVDLR